MAIMFAKLARPLSISIIGWVMVGSGLLSLLMVFLRAPLEFFGVILTGWSAMGGLVVLALTYILAGLGLLHLKPEARIAGIALFALFALNGLVNSFIPGTHAKLLEAMKGMRFSAKPASRPAPPPLPFAFKLVPIAVFAVPVWFLVTREKAFERPQIEVGGRPNDASV
jgi:hypothetical protein